MRAEERLAAFLLNLSERFHDRGFAKDDFILRMTREDIGSYLGMKLETVSRTFSRFNAEGILSVQGKTIHIQRPEGLKEITSCR
jgi:CRP/FNR family transcriptional regulator